MEITKTFQASLENKRLMFVEIGFVLSLMVVLMAFEFKSAVGHGSGLIPVPAVVIDDDDVIPIPLETPPAMPAVALPAPDEIIIVDDEVDVDDVFIETEDLATWAVNIEDYKTEVIEEAAVEEEIPIHLVQDKPTFQGGDANTFAKWVNERIVYPDVCRENNVSGRVMLQFTVDKYGNLGNIKVLREIDPALAREAVRVVSMSPKWEPGRQRGRAVNVTYTFPVQFQLK